MENITVDNKEIQEVIKNRLKEGTVISINLKEEEINDERNKK